MYVAFRAGRMTTAQVRRVFLSDFDAPGAAFPPSNPRCSQVKS